MSFEKIEGGKAGDPKPLAAGIIPISELNALYEKVVAERDKALLQIRQTEEARQSRKARCVEKCNHPADFVCDYEDGTLHCLECLAEKWWQVEDILSGKHNVHTYWGALETIAYPERYLTKYDPVRVAKDALKEKRNDLGLDFATYEAAKKEQAEGKRIPIVCDHGEIMVTHKCAQCGEVIEFT